MEKTRIMVVEDESIVAMDIKTSLQNMGYEVPAIVSSGNDAIAKAEETRPDLVLMDIVLRGKLNGIDAAGRIRSLYNIPVIYLTAYADDIILEQAKITEPFGYIIKPFHDKELRSAIKMALYKHGMEKKLKESEEWLTTVLEGIGDAVLATDAKGNVIFMNPVAEKLIRWSGEEAKGKPVDEILHVTDDETGERIVLPVKKVLEEGALVNLAAHSTLVARDGTRIPIDDSCASIRDAKGDVTGIVFVFHDITERKKAEEELKKHRDHLQELVTEQTAELLSTNEQLQKEIVEHKLAKEKTAQLLRQVESVNRELKDFVYITSHDLKSPLRAVGTLANWIATDYAEKLDEEGKEQLRLLVTRVNRMHALIDGILQYSRVEHVKEEKVQADLNTLVREAVEMIAPPENINITIEGKLPAVYCEKTRITEVFQNLLSNAVRYADKPEGRIRIGCVEDNGYWKISVADNGPGIEEKYFEKIFQIFQTLTPSGTEKSTGLGLTIVRKIISAHGGRVWLESEVGKGSTFFFTLPKGRP